MANRIYDFLPAHLRNTQLDGYFDATLERAFSKGNIEKTKAYVGRKEKGIYDSRDAYLTFPQHLYQRDNYGLEPVFTNTDASDNVYYDDLLNAMFNKGMLINDHRRLFKSKTFTVNLPIDQDKFANWALYYWVRPGFFTDDTQESNYKHYVTIDKSSGNWWGENNAWYHYDDIRELITADNKQFIEQAKRPIIEFDKNLQVTNSVSNDDWVQPEFLCSDDNSYAIFEFVTGTNYPKDLELGFNPKLKAGDYNSEFVFRIDLPKDVNYICNQVEQELYIDCDFNYRNLRHELGTGEYTSIELEQEALSVNDIDVYVDGMKKIGGYTYTDGVIEFTKPCEGYVYVDYTTKENVVVDGDNVWQRVDPSLEYNIDNEYHNLKEMTYSTVYEHMIRLIETTQGLTGEANGVNNFRQVGDNTDKLRFNNLGSVLVRYDIDIKKAYFAITRDDYDPIKSVEFLSNAYSSYKSKLITEVQKVLAQEGADTKSNDTILEQSVRQIALSKRESINVFSGTNMINFGSRNSHYTHASVDVLPNSRFQQLPSSIVSDIVHEENLSVYLNGQLQRYIIDYDIQGSEIVFTSYQLTSTDNLDVSYYSKLEETFIPLSSTKLNINSLYVPRIVSDYEYDPDVLMIVGHDGSMTPAWGDRTDKIILLFETLIFNRIVNLNSTTTDIDYFNYGMYRDASEEYTFSEKRFTQYPFFKKWMLRNNIDNLYNDTFDNSDWKTWNYRSVNDQSPGHWRGIMKYVYGTDNPVAEPWVTVGFSQEPAGFGVHGTNYSSISFWENLKTAYNKDWPVPVDSNGRIETMNNLFFNGQITNADILFMDQDWEFGDGSPVEMAWRRSSEFPFAEFLLMILTKPFEVLDKYHSQVEDIISYYHKHEGIKTSEISKQRESYTFKLGSKLGGFVNNFNLLSENSGLSNTRHTDIPKDNYDLVVHTGEPNRSESFSAIILEKVSIDTSYPTYNLGDTPSYMAGDIVYNPNDKKYYKRKTSGESTKEQSNTVTFDYSMWTMISQPKVRKFGYRVSGYDDFNPTFFAMSWDKTSGEQVWSTDGDPANINVWTSGEYYRQDSYTMFNNKAYVSLEAHTASTVFDNDIKKWKLLSEWPRVNTVEAYGYKETLPDQIVSYNYGDILESLDEVAQLMVGYQAYLKLIGWDFTDTDEQNRVVDFERLLEKFLDWSVEQNEPGDYIVLTPILFSGAFSAPYGVASIGRDANKNYYRVVDQSGRQVSDNMIDFYSDGSRIRWESQVPVYGVKVDIADVEHAFVVDRIDSYGDVIYDPFSHNRNLRMIIDCNRTADWNGTLATEGYVVYNNELIPNLETMIAETNDYRNTLVDQSLNNINKLKSSQIGYTPRTYLVNHGVERESQLEFYKGFLSAKSTVSSINRIVNKNSNYTDVKHKDIWAVKLADYGKVNNKLKATKIVQTSDIISDPHTVSFDMETPLQYRTTDRAVAIKTSGYVDPSDVNYTVETVDTLSMSDKTYYEGETAWVQFDEDREWDVRRLSEISEIAYIGETEDGQLYVALTNEIETDTPAYLKIKNVNIDPEIEGNYMFIDDGDRQVNGQTVYEYLVFDQSFEPVVVEIDTTTTNSTYVPTSSAIGVEAIGLVSNATLVSGDTLVIDGETFVYNPGSGSGTSTGISIGGTNATPDPVVSAGEQLRMVIYDDNGFIVNTNTLVTFTGTSITSLVAPTSNAGDKIDINGTTLEIDYSSTQSIRATSGSTTSDPLVTGDTLTVTSGSNTDTKSVNDIVITGTTVNPTIADTKSIIVNGVSVTFTVPATPSDITETNTASGQNINVTQSLTPSGYSVSTVTVDGAATTAFTVNGQVVNIPALVGGETVDITLTHVAVVMDTSDIISTINNSAAAISATLDPSNNIVLTSTSPKLTMTGSALVDIGMSSNSIVESKMENLAEELDTLSYITSYVSGDNLIIETPNNTLTLSGTALSDLAFPTTTYSATSNPTANSIASQIMSLGVSGVTASVVGGKVRITSTGSSLTVEENASTPGAMFKLGGFSTTSESIESIDVIVSDLSSAVAGANASVSKVGDAVLITSSEKTIVLSDVTGNPLSDLGINAGTYSNLSTVSNSILDFKDQINSQSTNITSSVTSDGRMVFTSNGTVMTFSGTAQSMLDKLGLSLEYTSVTSNANFKVMRWKSVRYTPNYNGGDFNEFYTNLGLNDTSLIWADDYVDGKWAILQRDNVGNLNIVNRHASVIDTSYIERVVVKSEDNYYTYQMLDPMNLRISGSIIKELDYIDWNDPAKYDVNYSDDIWLSQRLGEIWWDTTNARYYRYNDYGDANGILVESYARRFWGKLVSGSDITVKQWVSSETLPENTEWYNTEVYYDSAREKQVTKYYYWKDSGEDALYNKGLSVDEIRMMIASPTTTSKFLPIDTNKIILSNNANILTGDDIEVTLEYRNYESREEKHIDWELISKTSSKELDADMLHDFKNSLASSEIKNFEQIKVLPAQLSNTGADFTVQFVLDNALTVADIAISVNNVFVDPSNILISGANINISVDENIIEGDIVRIYHVVDYNGWFINQSEMRNNFKSVVEEILTKHMLMTEYANYDDYIKLNNGIIKAGTWAYSEEYETIENYDYLSKTRNIDMISLYFSGVGSFKIELPTHDEYYFPINNEIRLVNRTNSVISIDFDADTFNNQDKVQIHELMNMIYAYSENSEIKQIFFDMIEYMYTEKTHPEWIFKTSYIDLTMFNKSLRQYAIYQRDSYDDVIDYINETKPYHAKIREVDVIYPVEETANMDVEARHFFDITMYFGNHSRYLLNVIDGGDEEFMNTNDITDALAEGEYLQNGLLRRVYDNTSEAGGFDTGEFEAIVTDSSIVKIETYDDANRTTLDKKEFYVYDTLGRAYHIPVKFSGTISSFDGETLVVDQPSEFQSARGKTIRLIAIEKPSGKVEFMTYNKKSGTDLSIDNRALYDGIACDVEFGDTVHVLGVPDQIYSHEDA